MDSVRAAVEQAAATDAPTLIVGEIGTGKKLAARAIHAGGARAQSLLEVVSLRSGDVSRLESTLFGRDSEPGALDRTRGGTLVLDGMDVLVPELQSRLVGSLDGDLREVPGDRPRLVTTSRIEPGELLKNGLLTPELFFHLAVLVVRVPPLRDRKEDLPLLATEILKRVSTNGSVPELSPAALGLLGSRRWPGNVRELILTLRRAQALSPAGTIRREHLVAIPSAGTSGRTLAEIEREAIAATLAQVGGHRQQAASILGIGVRTLYEKIKRYSIEVS